MKEERRYFSAPDLEIRADEDGPFVVRGHAATFMEPYAVADFVEQIDPGAFDDQLDNPQVKALWNHDDGNVLGSVGAGTLKLGTDERGLTTETTFPQSAVREREAIERRDVDKMSFGFRTLADEWERNDDGMEVRTLLKVELFDVSPVAFPANPATDVQVDQRSRQEWKAAETDDEKARKAAYAARVRELDLAEMS